METGLGLIDGLRVQFGGRTGDPVDKSAESALLRPGGGNSMTAATKVTKIRLSRILQVLGTDKYTESFPKVGLSCDFFFVRIPGRSPVQNV